MDFTVCILTPDTVHMSVYIIIIKSISLLDPLLKSKACACVVLVLCTSMHCACRMALLQRPYNSGTYLHTLDEFPHFVRYCNIVCNVVKLGRWVMKSLQLLLRWIL